MPRYAALIYEPATTEGQGTEEEWAAIMAGHETFSAAAGAAGVIVGGEALQPTSTATTIRRSGGPFGDHVVTDGPFAETKEVLGGFYLLECADLDEAVRWASQIPGDLVEVRPVIDFSQM
ncbi:MAG TPA: transcription initiation protein [Acidimicrobiaceae bacterium]|nr:transcription initiation protein [Acidimicrobiaceae bacterium]